MNNYQREIYQPLAGKVPFYDLADQDPKEERPRAPVLVVIALIVLAAFAGVVWLAYTQWAEGGRQGASLAITAPEAPLRVASAEPAPAPTGLIVPTEPVPPERAAKTSAVAPQTAAKAEPPSIRLSPAAPPRAPAGQANQAVRAGQPAASAQAATAATPPAPSAAASAAASRAVSGGAVLQLGAFDSQELATRAWVAFRARYPSVARRLSPAVQRADLGAKGIMYRLRVGPFADRAAATNACIQLKAARTNCFVAAP